jgi:hypothetical protein
MQITSSDGCHIPPAADAAAAASSCQQHIDWHLAGGLGLLFKEGFPKADLPSGYEDDSDSTTGEPGYGPRPRRRYQYADSDANDSDEPVGRRPYRRYEEMREEMDEREPDSSDRNRYPEARNRVSSPRRYEDAREKTSTTPATMATEGAQIAVVRCASDLVLI